MRQQLIRWLIGDIIPEIRQSHNPESSILKFSHERNLPPAQVEMLGQLFNTAKTLSYLEKHATERGQSFPIVDVPELVSSYLKLPEEKTRPATKESFDLSLPQCLAGWQDLNEAQEIKIAAAHKPLYLKDRNFQQAEHNACITLLKQAKYDTTEQARSLMEDIHVALRSDANLQFPQMETDALSLYGEPAALIFNKLANYMAGNNWRVKRGARDDRNRLIPDHAGTMDKVASLIDLHFMVEAAEENILKTASTVSHMGGSAIALEPPPSAPATSETGEGHKKKDEKSPFDAIKAPPKEQTGRAAPSSSRAPARASSGGKPEKGKEHTAEGSSFFAPANRALDAAAGKGLSLLEPHLQSIFSGKNNQDQRQVDTDFQDTKHLAVLQKLLTTDESLAGADPERVVSVFNTIREVAPNLAGDVNVMRVALRSAVQHDGVSPFDLKSFLDTESARQKTDYNRQLEDAMRYHGQDIGNRPA